MKLLLPYPHRELHPIARLRAWHRLFLALTLGILGTTSTHAGLWETRLLTGWLAGSLTYLLLVWWGTGASTLSGPGCVHPAKIPAPPRCISC